MTALRGEHVERAKRLLAHEGAREGDSVQIATAACRVFDRLSAHLSPILGAAGVETLFARSARLLEAEYVCLAAVSPLGGSTKLRECLCVLDPADAGETAEALFGTFFALMGVFIGERLTNQVLRGAWPAIEDAAPRETKK